MESIFKPKLFTVFKNGYSRKMGQTDFLSGIIVGIVALPLAIAFAVASGVSPEKGLITAVIAGFIISFFGGSRVQIGGPTGAFIVVVAGVIHQYGIEGLMISTILAGLILVAFGLLRLGVVIKFIPHPLIVGFTSGIALIIFSTQIKDGLGLTTEMPSEFIGKWHSIFSHLSEVNVFAISITVATILITVLFKKVTSRVPGSFVAIIVTTAAVALFNLPVHTIETVFGEIPSSFSVDIPSIDWSKIGYYFAPAITIALLGAIESLLSAVVADGMIGGNHRSNTELIAQGIANVVTPIFGGIPATGAIARTATNVKNGGRTPIAGIVHAITLLLIMLFFGKWAKLIPMSCLAGVLIVVSYNMSEWRSFLSITKGSKYDIVILLTTFFLTVLVDLTIAIEVGMVLASMLFMQRMASQSQIVNLQQEGSDALENYSYLPKGIEVYEISGPFFFAAAKTYRETLRGLGRTSSKVLVIRMRHVPFIDSTGIHNFESVIKELNERHVKVILSGVNDSVFEELEKSRLAFRIGKNNICKTFDDAVRRAQEALDEIELKKVGHH